MGETLPPTHFGFGLVKRAGQTSEGSDPCPDVGDQVGGFRVGVENLSSCWKERLQGASERCDAVGDVAREKVAVAGHATLVKTALTYFPPLTQ